MDGKKITYVPKLYNFESAIDIDRKDLNLYDELIKEEFFNFGLVRDPQFYRIKKTIHFVVFPQDHIYNTKLASAH